MVDDTFRCFNSQQNSVMYSSAAKLSVLTADRSQQQQKVTTILHMPSKAEVHIGSLQLAKYRNDVPY